MSRLVVINLGLGSLEKGCPNVLAQIWSEAGSLHSMQVMGSLPTAPALGQLYRCFQLLYRRFYQQGSRGDSRRLTIPPEVVTQFSEVEFLCRQLKNQLNAWLKSEEFLHIERQLRSQLDPLEEIRVIIQTQDELLQRLPWQGWDFFKDYPNAVMALSRPEYRPREPSQPKVNRKKVRILAILGDSQDIELERERQLLKSIPDAEIEFLLQPERQEFNNRLWDNLGWDLLFFAGHSQTEGKTGRIYINEKENNNSLTIEELEEALRAAIEGGLKLAIFNSCEGLGLANALAKLDIPQVIVMREPVPNLVAEEFFRYFLQAYALKQLPLYLAVQEARRKLQGLEDKFPAASWLPTICQNPAILPPSWLQLGGIPPCPYRGLSAFGEEDAQWFKGRETFTDQLVGAVKRKPLVAVIGASGSGKSSVVLAGLIPQLRSRGTAQVVSFRPGKDPFEALATALAPLWHQRENNSSLAELELAQALRQNAHSLYELRESIAQENPGKGLVLVADQFEELCTLCSEEDCYPFLDRLLNAVNRAPAFTLVLTLRADFFGRALSYPPLAKALQEYPPELLIPMNHSELSRAIALPAAAMNVELEEGLTKRLIDDVGSQPGRLPLLEFALTQLWSKQRNGQLTHQAYEEIGGVEEALALHAEGVYAQLSEADRKRAQRVFIQLVCPGIGTEDTRRLATREEIKKENWDLVTGLASSRLVVTNRNSSTGVETVEIVHEALMRSWGRLAQWIQMGGEFRRWQEQLRAAMHQWEDTKQDEGALLGGVPLAEAQEWLKKHLEELSDSERKFIQLSLEQRERQIKKEKCRVVVLRSLLCLVSGALVVAVGGGVIAFNQSQEAKHQTAIKKATLVRSWLPSKPLEGLVQAIEATGSSQSFWAQVPKQVESSLLEAIQVAREGTIERNILRGHEGLVSSVVFSPDSKYIASGSYDNKVRLWDLEGNPIGQPFQGHEDAVNSVVFSPDGKYIASAGLDQTVRLWDLEGNPIGKPFQGHEDVVYSVSFSPDGKYIASGGFDNNVRLWDLEGNPIGKPFQGHEDVVLSVVFSPDGKYIASSSDDNTVRLWDLEGNPIGKPFRGHQNWVNSVTFSPDGKYIASGSYDNTVRLWDLEGNSIGQPFRGHEDVVYSVSFSPDGKYITSGSFDNTVRLWNLQGNPIGKPFRGHKGTVNSVTFSPDGKYIASGSGDKTVRLWDRQGRSNELIFLGHDGVVRSVAFSPDGKYIVSGGKDNTLQLWNREGRPIGKPFRGHKGTVNSVAFSPDGKYITSGSDDKTVRLWDLEGNSIGEPFQGHWTAVLAVAFSPDGKYIASGAGDNTVRLWDRQGNPIGEPFDHMDVVSAVAFSPDGKYIASGGCGTTVRLWDRQGKSIGEPFPGHGGFINSVAWSPDGKYIVSGSDDTTVRLWDRQGNPIGEPFQGHEGFVRSVAFSPDGKYIVSGSGGSDDNAVRLWDLKGNSIGEPFRGHGSPVNSVAFSPNGKYIVSGSGDKTVRLWDREGNWQTWLQVACNRLRNHSVLTNPQTEEAKGARETCQKYVWGKEESKP